MKIEMQPIETFEQWFGKALGQSPAQVAKLLENRTATRFLIAWSLFENRCFEGEFKSNKIEKYANDFAKGDFDLSPIESQLTHFLERYKSKKSRDRLQHKKADPRFELVAQNEFDSLSAEDCLYFAIYVVFRFRNNIFHGNKRVESWLKYSEQIQHCISIMQALISHSEQRRPHLASWCDTPSQ